MNSLSAFIGQFKRGFQQANRFVVQVIVSPTTIGNIITDSLQTNGSILGLVETVLAAENSVLSVPQVVKWLAQGYLCESVRLPDRALATVDMTQYGYTEKFPYHTDYTALACHFRMPYAFNISNDNAVPRFFSYWQNTIQRAQQGPESGFDFRFPSEYYATVLLTLLDRQNKGSITYKFDRAYPKLVNSTELGWAQEGWATLPVEFTFSYWTILPQAESLALSFVDVAFEAV